MVKDKKTFQKYEIGGEEPDAGSVEIDIRQYHPKSQGKTKMFLRRGGEMIGGEIHGQTLRGKAGAVHRHTTGEIPRGLTKIEEEVWKLQQKEKNK